MQYARAIREESMRLSSMASNVLSLSKVENQTILTDVSQFNLSEQVRSAVLLLEEKWVNKNIDLQLDFDEFLIEANEELLKQVWINLIDNAVKFVPRCGTVELEIFEKENPDIKINYETYYANEEMYVKVANNSSDYDVVFPSDYMIEKMISENMLKQLNFDNIPNYEHIMQRFKGLEYDPQEKYSVPYLWGSICLLYNSKYVDEAPTSWDILWDEKYNGKTLMYNNSRDAIGLSLIRDKKSVNSENVDELTAAANNIIELKKNLQAFVSDEIFNRMESESAYITPAYAGDALSMIEENPNLSIATPEEGTNMYIDAMCIVKNSKNKEAAEKYINFMCIKEIAIANAPPAPV